MAGQRALVLLTAAVAVFAVSGCSGGREDDGLTPQQSSRGEKLNAIFKKSGGDWEKLTPEDKQVVLSATNGDENLARRMWMIRGGTQIGPGGGPANKK